MARADRMGRDVHHRCCQRRASVADMIDELRERLNEAYCASLGSHQDRAFLTTAATVLTALIDPPDALVEAVALDTMNARYPRSGDHAKQFSTGQWSSGLRDARASIAAAAAWLGELE